MKLLPLPGLILVAALLGACAAPVAKKPAVVAAPVTAPPPASVAAGPAPDDNLNAVAWTQTSVEHDLIYREVYRNATDRLDHALADRSWDALPHEERTGPLRGLKPAIILDIDETVLDNTPYAVRRMREGKGYESASWRQWCEEKAAKPLPGALEFTRHAASRGVTVFYVTNRSHDVTDATIANLREQGFPLAAGEDVVLALGTVVPGCEPSGSDKGCRRRLVAQHYRVLMQFGDQLGDFVDVRDNTPAGHRAAVAPYLGWVGERWFVLPNPTYGAWEAVLFGNDWKLPPEQRRALKYSNMH
ncbi:MAG: 5'-nucleotidase, lipoprotein e(P4) family [Dokdonella sp.]|uniref:5'-nucleotidase, lipoprotein e(P4) family n=2 Tax=Dokdonella sp. TaxID=2291710 RepID=UPI0025C07FA4|nr:5'-nucleotidase, lipoprotein e(P4) family [Dokdonella sp.]MBX3700411.1 5'-nucleotidase, lipoprotein e(P4) family [Dokdonella sp.]